MLGACSDSTSDETAPPEEKIVDIKWLSNELISEDECPNYDYGYKGSSKEPQACRRTHEEAVQYCDSRGGRLPTVKELENAYKLCIEEYGADHSFSGIDTYCNASESPHHKNYVYTFHASEVSEENPTYAFKGFNILYGEAQDVVKTHWTAFVRCADLNQTDG